MAPSAEASETELAKAMLQQQMDTMFEAMKQIEVLVSQNLSALNDRIRELSARVNQLQKNTKSEGSGTFLDTLYIYSGNQ